LEERRDRLADLSASLREQGYDGDLCGRIAREAMAIADIIDDMRGVDAQVEAIAGSETVGPRSSESACQDEDPHADAPLTIEATALEQAPNELVLMAEPFLAQEQIAPVLQVDLSALEAVEALPRAERLALFS
jgi:hypothetical protein